MAILKRKFFACAALCIFFFGCNSKSDEMTLSGNPGNMSRSEAEGEELFRTHCITCHSLRYIDMQPAFPRKTWEKITDKMIKSFGAPITDSSAVKIVDYLMSVKGAKK